MQIFSIVIDGKLYLRNKILRSKTRNEIIKIYYSSVSTQFLTCIFQLLFLVSSCRYIYRLLRWLTRTKWFYLDEFSEMINLLSIVEINQEKMIWSHLQNGNKFYVFTINERYYVIRYNLYCCPNWIFICNIY